jgi:hypothetical protein
MRRTEVLQGIREMRFLEVYDRSRPRQLSYSEAAETLGMSERSFRRLRGRYEAEGEAGLLDCRLGKVSPHRIAADEVDRIVSLYRDRYAGWAVKHFHERSPAHRFWGLACLVSSRAVSPRRSSALPRTANSGREWIACSGRTSIAAHCRRRRGDGRSHRFRGDGCPGDGIVTRSTPGTQQRLATRPPISPASRGDGSRHLCQDRALSASRRHAPWRLCPWQILFPGYRRKQTRARRGQTNISCQPPTCIDVAVPRFRTGGCTASSDLSTPKDTDQARTRDYLEGLRLSSFRAYLGMPLPGNVASWRIQKSESPRGFPVE